MNDPALLVHRYLEGLLDTDEAREFNERVKRDPEFRTLLARMSYDAAALRDLFVADEAPKAMAPVAPARRFAWPVAAAAAVLIGIVAMVVVAKKPAPGPEVVSGRVEVVNGRTVVKEAAVIRFRGGATAELEPQTEAVLRDSDIDLLRGGGRFHGALRVKAPIAVVTGTEFKVELRADSLIVTGDVEIDRDGLRSRMTGEKILPREKRGAEHRGWVGHDRRLHKASITLLRAIEIATEKGGAAVDAKLEKDEGRLVFKVQLADGQDVTIDAVSGRELERDDEKPERAPGITLAKAVEAALKDIPGQAVDADVDENGTIEVTVVWGDRLVWVRLDSATGAVVDRGIETEED